MSMSINRGFTVALDSLVREYNIPIMSFRLDVIFVRRSDVFFKIRRKSRDAGGGGHVFCFSLAATVNRSAIKSAATETGRTRVRFIHRRK